MIEMRLFFLGPRILGIRPGVSLAPEELFGRGRPRATATTGSFVYVLRGDHNMTKIGVSTNPNARLAQLRTASAFPIDFAFVGVTPGTGFDIERAAHALLANHRCNGEWFDVTPEIAVAAVHAAAHRLGQPIQTVEPAQIEHILRIAAVGDPSRPRLPWILKLILYVAAAAIGAVIAFIGWLVVGALTS
jgi:hypothetical protein